MLRGGGQSRTESTIVKMQKESGLSFLSRIGTRSESVYEIGKEIFESPLLPPEIIEISGNAGVGKSLLCLDLMAKALLPKTIFNIPLGGLNTSAIFIDCDQHFSILHFVDLMERKIKRACHTVRSEWKKLGDERADEELMTISRKKFNAAIDNIIKECLKNLFYFKCTDSNQFFVSILSLEQFLRTKSNVSLLFIDSISSFYWYDRIYKANSWQKMESYLNNILHTFLDIIKKNYLVCICTKQNLFLKKKDKDNINNFNKGIPEENLEEELVAYEFLGKEWSAGVSVKINMSFSKQSIEEDSVADNLYVIETVRGEESKVSYCTLHEDGIRWVKDSL